MQLLVLVHAIILFIWFRVSTPASGAESFPLVISDCESYCGNVSIPYPFGMGPNRDCYVDEWFQIDCRTNDSTSKPFLKRAQLEVLNISIHGTILVNSPVTFFCQKNIGDQPQPVNLAGSPFVYSQSYNVFTSVSCDLLAILYSGSDYDAPILGGCSSVCDETTTMIYDGCDVGINCCLTSLPPYLTTLVTHLLTPGGYDIGPENCSDINAKSMHAFLVEKEWFKDSSIAAGPFLKVMDKVPVVLEWSLKNCSFSLFESLISRRNSSAGNDPTPNCIVEEYYTVSGYNRSKASRIYCYCPTGFEGNPYLRKPCQDIDECTSDPNLCSHDGNKCLNVVGAYSCQQINTKVPRSLLIGLCSGTATGTLLLLIGAWYGYRLLKKNNYIKQKELFFKRNGGLLLQQQLSPGEVDVKKIKLFDSEELEKSTDNFHVDRILGQGGQGTVYKGMMTDGRIVAVKKAKIVDESQLSGFINEVVVLSQINHRNVVKLLGCCLETEVPLLVYEFIPNGTLSQYIQAQNEEFPLTWEMRLRIATEIAGALSYLHSAASCPIYHTDIKSTNILLDEKYRAKLADFGTSRSIAIDQTHLTTSLVHGTFGYLDPEYFQSSQFTEKSDVYSFGVVLVELLTGLKPICLRRSEEGRSLASFFIISMEEDRLVDILDDRVLKEGSITDITIVASLAKRCLNLNGRLRPAMREVTAELEGIQMTSSRASSVEGQSFEDIEFN